MRRVGATRKPDAAIIRLGRAIKGKNVWRAGRSKGRGPQIDAGREVRGRWTVLATVGVPYGRSSESGLEGIERGAVDQGPIADGQARGCPAPSASGWLGRPLKQAAGLPFRAASGEAVPWIRVGLTDDRPCRLPGAGLAHLFCQPSRNLLPLCADPGCCAFSMSLQSINPTEGPASPRPPWRRPRFPQSARALPACLAVPRLCPVRSATGTNGHPRTVSGWLRR